MSQLTRTFSAMRKAWLMFMIRSLEKQLHDQREARCAVRSDVLRSRIQSAEAETREDLAKFRSAYTGTLPVQVTTVTLTDCGKAISSIEAEMQRLAREKTELERRLSALRTQGLMIRELARRLS